MQLDSAYSTKLRDRTSLRFAIISQLLWKRSSRERESTVSNVCVILMLSRMFCSCMSGFYDRENEIRIHDPYVDELVSIWFIRTVWHENWYVKSRSWPSSGATIWSCSITCSIGIRHCKLSEFLINCIRTHSVPSNKDALKQVDEGLD